MKKLVLLAALGLVLTGCATEKVASPVVASAPVEPPRPVLKADTAPGPWRVRKTEWTAEDEAGFGEFVREIAESGCTTTIACMQSATNIYHDTDAPAFQFHADCAKWVYMLRAYYAAKNGLPFSYVSKIAGSGEDLRYTQTSNVALERHDVVDTGTGIDTTSVLQHLHDQVWSATYRMDPVAELPVQQDFYSPKITPGAIRPGTAIYDINGHVMIIYQVTMDGSILYMDAHPDESVTRGSYGAQVPKSAQMLGGGFKNFRPLKLEGATLMADGTYIGGHVVLASNDAIAEYSLEQYRGNVASATNDEAHAQFRYNNASLDLYEYARAAMSKGSFALNPVYELQIAMGSLCREAQDGSREADARVKTDLLALYADLSHDVDLWKQRDLRVVYHGISLKETLADTYTTQEHACVIAGDGGRSENPLDDFLRRAPGYDPQRLIASIDDHAPFAGMRPVGY